MFGDPRVSEAELVAGLEGIRGLAEVDLSHVIDTMPQIVWITRPDGWHEFYNQQWFAFTGLAMRQCVGHGWNPAFHHEDRVAAAERWQAALSTGEPYEVEYRLRRHDGVYRWMLGRAMPLRDASGTIVKWLGTCTDIEDLKRAQVEVDEGRTLRRLAGSMARLGGWSIDLAAHRVTWSEEIYEILDYPRDTDPDLDDSIEHYVSEHRATLDAALDACATHGTPFDLELEMVNYAGRRLWVRAIGEARYDDRGRITHLTGALQDISQLKASVQRTRVLAERLTTTLESITDGFYTVARDWTLTYVNARGEELLQRGREELLGEVIWEAYPGVVGTIVETEYRRAMDEHATVVLDEYYYPALETWFQVHVYPSTQGIAVYFRDITEQRAARHALHERVKELRALATVSRVAHELSDASSLCRATAQELVAAMQDPEHVSVEVVLGDERATAGTPDRTGHVCDTAVTADGLTVGSITVVSRPEFLDEERSLFAAVAETLALWTEHRRANRRLEHVNHELEQANVLLEDAAQLKDDLLSMASHELRTPLTPILGFLELLQTRMALTDDQQQLVGVIENNSRRMLRLVDDLMVVNRATAGVLDATGVDVHIAEVLDAVLHETGDLIGPVVLEFDDAPRVHVDPQHLQQMVLNLVTNAHKYGAPPVTIRSDCAGDIVRIAVTDRGPGVPAAFREMMWARFSQHDRGDARTATGVGLGLTIVKLLAEVNDGHVTYHDHDPTGAVFTLHLPAARPDTGEQASGSRRGEAPAGSTAGRRQSR